MPKMREGSELIDAIQARARTRVGLHEINDLPWADALNVL